MMAFYVQLQRSEQCPKPYIAHIADNISVSLLPDKSDTLAADDLT